MVAFSGGPDSTALLWALTRVAQRHPLRLLAAHLDHGLDAESAVRAEHARRLAATLEVPFECERWLPDARGEGLEAAARRERYAFLRRCRESFGATHIAVGHHRDDQVATVVLRMLFGSGVAGLGAMREARGDVLRPLLDVERAQLAATLDSLGLTPARDPGNDDLRRPRNRVEARLVPWLRARQGISDEALLALAAAARGADRRVRARLREVLSIDTAPAGERARLRLAVFDRLPEALRPYALDALRRRAGARYPAPARARRELDRQLAAGGAVGCDCGDGWAWTAAGDWLELHRPAPVGVGEFSYRLRVPGEVAIPEVGLTLRLFEAEPAPWMFRGSASRAAMNLPLEVGQKVLIRNRRPGDRLRPFGCGHERKLKDILIDRQIGRETRDALPLLVVDDRIAWVPGVTIDHAFRLAGNQSTWVAELDSLTARPH